MEWLAGIFGLALGAAIGAALVAFRAAARRSDIEHELAQARARTELLDGQAARQERDIASGLEQIREAHRLREAAERDAAVVREQLAAQQRQFVEHKRLLDEAEKKLTDTFKAVGADALRHNNQQFIDLARETFGKIIEKASGDVDKKQQAIDALVKPIRELLEKQSAAVGDIEKKRESAYARLDEQIKAISASHDGLRMETNRLVTALRRPEVRGKWGEQQLRNVVELAGMTAHCDFLEQQSMEGDDGRQRPDLIVRLPGEGVIVVDSKVALDAYFSAIECEDHETRSECLRRHARQLSDHISTLAEKRYWDAAAKVGKRTPKLVVMFVSPESALISALDADPELHSWAMSRHVLLATPTLLVALLRAIAYGWQQEDLAENTRAIAQTGKELYDRLGKFVSHFEDVGKALERGHKAYNSAIGSMERSVLPSARKLKELHATTENPLELPTPLDVEVRQISAAELKPVAEAP